MRINDKIQRFRQRLRLYAKLGVVDSICKVVASERKLSNQWPRPNWEDEKWTRLLYDAIESGKIPLELIHGFVQTAEVTLFTKTPQPTVDKVLEAVDEILEERS